MGAAFMTYWVGHLTYVWSIYGLNGWGSYGKLSCCCVWNNAAGLQGSILFLVIARPQVSVSLNFQPLAYYYRKGVTLPT